MIIIIVITIWDIDNVRLWTDINNGNGFLPTVRLIDQFALALQRGTRNKNKI